MKRTAAALAGILAAAVALAACARMDRMQGEGGGDIPAPLPAAAPPMEDKGALRKLAAASSDEGAVATEAVAVPGPAPGALPAPRRMILRTVDLQLVVADSAGAVLAVARIAADQGGYVASSNTWQDGTLLRGSATLRVPAEKLDATVAALRGLAVRVTRESVTGQDVTEEYADLGAQRRNLEAAETELRELLATVRQRTQKAADIMEVYRELTEVRGRIEQIQGRMQFYENLAALSTVNVEIVPDALSRPVVEPGWQPLAVLRNAGRSLLEAMKFLVNAAIWVFVFALPVAIVIAAPIAALVLLLRAWLRRRRARRAKA